MIHGIRFPRAALLAVVLALAACQAPVEQWQPVEAPKTNKLEVARFDHTIRFAPGSAVLTPAETQRLSAFLRDADLEGNETVSLAAPAGDRLGSARESALRRILARRHVRAAALPPTATPGATALPGDTVLLQVERIVVTPPNCPNWTKPPGGDPTNTPASNFGCATAVNLGMMVADPRDLLIGRRPGPPDAEPALRAIQNYRAGKPIVLPDESTNQAAPSASGGGPSASGGGSGTGN